MAEIRSRVEKDNADKPAQGTIESELKEAAKDAAPAPSEDPASAEADTGTAVPTSVVNAEDFVLRFNPDAFVERKPTDDAKDAVKIYDTDEESTKNVREASKYLRDTILSSFIAEVAASTMTHTDGFFLSKLMHRKGINMRYLGLLARKIDSEGEALAVGPNKEDIQTSLRLLKQSLQLEMVARASKHILRRLMKASDAYDHPYFISHFFNCLLGTSFQPSPVAEVPELATGVTVDRAWSKVTPDSLRADITSEVESRFRYPLPPSVLTQSLVHRKLLREISLRVGIQLVARRYEFQGDAAAAAAASAASTSASTEEEKKETSATASKKKKSKSAKTAEAAPRPVNIPAQTFRPEDVLNIMPVVKSSTQKVR